MPNDVDQYIAKQKSPQKEILQRLRMIILTTFPNIIEELKLGVPYYEDKFYLVALRAHVNLGFAIKDLTPEQIGFFEGSGKTMKHLKIVTLKDIDEPLIVSRLQLVKP